jgi:hypothetical protein
MTIAISVQKWPRLRTWLARFFWTTHGSFESNVWLWCGLRHGFVLVWDPRK